VLVTQKKCHAAEVINVEKKLILSGYGLQVSYLAGGNAVYAEKKKVTLKKSQLNL
jgi:hypothetical protein